MEMEQKYDVNLGRQIFFDALKTTPYYKWGGDLTFGLTGIYPPEDPAQEAEYIRSCELSDIMPFSTLNFRFNEDRRQPFTLLQDDKHGLLPSEKSYVPYVLNGLLQGGRINIVNIHLRFWLRPKPRRVCEDFVDNYLHLFTTKGYSLVAANVNLMHDGDMASVQYKSHNTHLNFKAEGDEATLGLSIGRDTKTEWKIQTLTDWFHGLSDRPQSQLSLLVNT